MSNFTFTITADVLATAAGVPTEVIISDAGLDASLYRAIAHEALASWAGCYESQPALLGTPRQIDSNPDVYSVTVLDYR